MYHGIYMEKNKLLECIEQNSSIMIEKPVKKVYIEANGGMASEKFHKYGEPNQKG